jgi:hypothetical protein
MLIPTLIQADKTLCSKIYDEITKKVIKNCFAMALNVNASLAEFLRILLLFMFHIFSFFFSNLHLH